ncbi:MAG: TadE/TadG family type IV pilus assembly protein [Novosphingobium sp.]
MKRPGAAARTAANGLARRLLRDERGATLIIGAASMVVLMVLIGSSVDAGRAYMTKTSLQSACDAGVLAGRRALSRATSYGTAEQAKAMRMFDFNFNNDQSETRSTAFTSVATDDGSVVGQASTILPTAIMHIFGFPQFNLAVSCSAELQLASADVMFVLDTTGSMNCNPGVTCSRTTEDTNAKIKGLRTAVRNFYMTVAAAVENPDETRIRFAFVPYSMTVNVRKLIEDGRMPTSYIASATPYQSREAQFSTTPSYLATPGAATAITETISGVTSAQCSTAADNYGNNRYPSGSGGTPIVTGSAPGNITTVTYSSPSNPWTRGSGNTGTCRRTKTTVVTTHTTRYAWTGNWRYKPLTLDTSAYRSFSALSLVTGIASTAYAPSSGWFDVQALARLSPTTGLTTTSYTWGGCIEERETARSATMNPVPSGATDLDINSAPTSEPTRWKPYFGGAEFHRGNSNLVSLTTTTDIDNLGEACPSPMRVFENVDVSNPTTVPTWLNTYLNDLDATGNTYHDIGMIWGGRLASPRGIFAAVVNDEPERSISRNLIFMTDGDMDPTLDLYSAYGVERFDNRVAPSGASDATLTSYHNARFLAACRAAKAEGYTVWVIGFGTSVTSQMTECSSGGRAYLSNNSAELTATFRFIASQVADLRLNQ